MQKVELGDKVRDSISGLEGIVVGITDYLYGCKHVLVNPQKLHDGKPVDSQYFDEDRVVVIKKGAVKRPETADDRRGSPVGRFKLSR